MTSRRIRALGVVCAAIGLTLGMTRQVEAAPITIDGGIRFGGAISANTNFGTANAIDIVGNVASILCFSGWAPCTGDYASLNGVSPGVATYNDFAFNPLPAGGIAPLWTFTIGAMTYSFDLTRVTSFTRTPDGLGGYRGISIFGSGVARITGFTDTVADWSFSADRSRNTFAFSSTTDAGGVAVPEPGSMWLFGSGLVGLVAARRRLTRK